MDCSCDPIDLAERWKGQVAWNGLGVKVALKAPSASFEVFLALDLRMRA